MEKTDHTDMIFVEFEKVVFDISHVPFFSHAFFFEHNNAILVYKSDCHHFESYCFLKLCYPW